MLASLFLFGASHSAHAFELFVLEGQAISPVVYQAPEDVTTQINDFAAHLTVPVPLRENTYLLPWVGYRLEAPRFIDPSEHTPAVSRLHDIEAGVSLYETERGPWSLFGRVSAGLAGDLASIDRGVVRLGGVALVSREVAPHARIGVGIAASYVFGELLPVPLLQARWAPSEAILFEALLPSEASLTYTWNHRLRAGGLAELIGNEYALRGAGIRARYCPEGGNPTQCIDHLAYTDGNAGALFGAKLAGGLWLEANAGVSFYRRFELLNAQGNTVDIGDQRLDPAGYARLRLIYDH